MNITVNGQSRNISDSKLLAELLEELDLVNSSLAIAVNQEVIPRSQYAETLLQTDDVVELVQAVGGG